MNEKTATSFCRTREALEAYDADTARRDALWDAAETNEDVYAAEAEDKKAADLVREAFAEDTKNVNSRDRAFLVGPNDPWLRGLVAKYGAAS
jgi:hypothetical protein